MPYLTHCETSFHVGRYRPGLIRSAAPGMIPSRVATAVGQAGENRIVRTASACRNRQYAASLRPGSAAGSAGNAATCARSRPSRAPHRLTSSASGSPLTSRPATASLTRLTVTGSPTMASPAPR